MKQSILVALLTTGVSLSSVAVAQYVGATEAQYTNLAQLLETGKDDDYVQLKGQLIKKVGSEKYIFTDGNQEVRVEIDSDAFRSHLYKLRKALAHYAPDLEIVTEQGQQPNPYQFDIYWSRTGTPLCLSSYVEPGHYEHQLGPEDKHFKVSPAPSGEGLYYLVFKDDADDFLDDYETRLHEADISPIANKALTRINHASEDIDQLIKTFLLLGQASLTAEHHQQRQFSVVVNFDNAPCPDTSLHQRESKHF